MATSLTAPTTEYGADALIVCDNLVRIYQVENIEVQALQGLDLLVDKGEMIAIVGQSGSGKSTLLNVLSGLDVPTAGAARVGDWDLLRMSHADRLTYRRSVVGFVWQQTARNLLPYLTARENVMLPMAFSGLRGRKRIKRATELLEAMDMGALAHRRPGQLSGGQQQRVAIAVALANSPSVIFADEPTGELDSATGDDVFEALRAANRDMGATVVVVTHDHAVSSQVQRTVAIRDGRTATEVVRRTQMGADGQAEVVHEEYAVLDRAGRLQLPKDFRSSLGLKSRVLLELEPDHVGIWPDGTRPKRRSALPDVPGIPAPVSALTSATGETEDDSPAPAPAPDFDPYAPVDAVTEAEARAEEPGWMEDPAATVQPPVSETPSRPVAPQVTRAPVQSQQQMLPATKPGVYFTAPTPKPVLATTPLEALEAAVLDAGAPYQPPVNLRDAVVPVTAAPVVEAPEPAERADTPTWRAEDDPNDDDVQSPWENQKGEDS